ncbi:MAG: hypothetical protein M3R15_16090 [Acidobacteriota bacterium]|nr:hypothetical protein [Acidobacteriota bacterium]
MLPNEYEEHELSQILPMMSDGDLQTLADDIKENGQRAPITLLDGKILDGRNRYRACVMVDVKPRYKDFNGDGDPLAFIISANINRRHLTESQRALVAAKIAGLTHGGDRRSNQEANLPLDKTIAEAAKELKVSPRNVRTGKQVLRDAPPEEVQKVERGEKSLHKVAQETKAKAAAKSEKPETPKQQLDKTGYAIPPGIVADWDRAEETARRMLAPLSKLRSELKTVLDVEQKSKDVIYAEINNTTIADINNAYGSLKGIRPYAVCSSCGGHGRAKCALCKGRGFLSQFAWNSYVPAEIKKIRAGGK